MRFAAIRTTGTIGAGFFMPFPGYYSLITAIFYQRAAIDTSKAAIRL